MNVRSGLDELLRKIPPSWKSQRIGIVCHQASVDARLRHIIDLLTDKGLRITAIFGPEHGLYGTAQDQVEVKSGVRSLGSDRSLGLTPATSQGVRPGQTVRPPVYSLYAETRYPTAEMLQNVDILICDLQDVGSRYYTFVWTMALCLQACAKYGKKFVVLDRPNPLNGVTMEGPVLNPEFASFVGLYPVPVRHGMTIGELALWINEGLGIGADLEVIRMKGWRRSMYFDETGLPWVLPSPNMPTLDTATVYPGACLIEGTNLSEGRGTTRPFEMIGAPFIQESLLAKLLNQGKLPGVLFRACRFKPTFHKFQGESCGGIQIHVTDRQRFKPFLTGLAMIQIMRALTPDEFSWRPPPYEYETEKLPFDILCGTDTVRCTIEADRSIQSLEKGWAQSLQAFARQRKPFLLYN